MVVLHHCRTKRLYHYYLAYQQQFTSAGIPKAACPVPRILVRAFSPTTTTRIFSRSLTTACCSHLVGTTPRSCSTWELFLFGLFFAGTSGLPFTHRVYLAKSYSPFCSCPPLTPFIAAFLLAYPSTHPWITYTNTITLSIAFPHRIFSIHLASYIGSAETAARSPRRCPASAPAS